jgi:hypothetical protein
MKRTLIAVLAASLVFSQFAAAWGLEGHQIIAKVAENHLDETTKIMVQSLIGNNNLYSTASWADEIRKDRRETGPWHYVDIPLGGSYVASRDCAPPKSCVVEKISEYVKVLTDKHASREERAEALRFVVHFVGDVHQPFHAVGNARGGNDIRVRFLDSAQCGPYTCELHGVWDTSMILRTGLRRDDYAARLEDLIKRDHLDGLAGGTPEQWANDSARLAKAAWVPDGANLDEQYFEREITVADRQMALAGLRLAKLLNETVGKMTPKDFAGTGESSVTPAIAQPQTIPSGQAESTAKVWVNTRSGVYHCPTSEYYGKTKQGEFMSEAEAQKNGYLPVGGKTCR